MLNIIFPVNRISNARFIFEDREYVFPVDEPETGCFLHGNLQQQEFQMISGGKDYVICSYKATKEEPYLMFPHEFEVIISYYLTDEGLKQKTEQKISRHYKCGNSGKMYIDDTKRKIRILYENSANLGFRMIYNGDADKFICLEPQNCVVDCMNTTFDREYSGFEYVEPFQSKTYYSKISVCML